MAIEYLDFLKMHQRARDYLQEASSGMIRYSSPLEGQPYWTHPVNVHNFLVVQGVVDYETLIAALLHDAEEDFGASTKFIAQNFNERIASIVHIVSKPPNYDPNDFYRGIMQFPDDSPRRIKVADRVDNLVNFYSYSENALHSDKYIDETAKYFVPMAKKIEWEQPLNGALKYFMERNTAARSQ